MDNSGKDNTDNTDDTSIKPVSSLRSHFESLANIKPTPPGPTIRTSMMSKLQPSSEQRDIGTVDRASLDIPRKASPWNTPDNSVIQAPQQWSQVVSIPHRPESPLRQRPLSVGPLSPPRYPPTVTINPPQSPLINRLQSFNEIPISDVTTSGTLQSSRIASTPPRAISPHPAQLSNGAVIEERDQRLTSDNKTFRISPKPRRRTSQSTHLDATTNVPVPPLVNRAEKPKFSTKSSMIIDKTSSELEVAVIDNRISPFSTPPSSDDSPEIKHFHMQLSRNKQPSRATARSPFKNDFPPPPVHHSLQGSRRDIENSIEPRLERNESRAISDTRPSTIPTELRPGLPPRREVGEALNKDSKPTLTESSFVKAKGGRITSSGQGPPSGLTAPPHAPGKIIHAMAHSLPPPKPSISSRSRGTPRAAFRTQSQTDSPLSGISTGNIDRLAKHEAEGDASISSSTDYPDASHTNRRPPSFKAGIREIQPNFDTRLFDICGQHVCATGYLTKSWDLLSGDLIMSLAHGEKEIRVTALAFKPGATANHEGLRLWLGTNYGDIQEVDLSTQSVLYTKSSAHNRREVIKIYRHQNSMWTLDDDGKLLVWTADETGLPNLQCTPLSLKVPKGHTFSLVIEDTLWLATGKDIRVFRPGSSQDASFLAIQHPLSQPNVGEVTSGAVINSQLHRVYFGHADGKVTIYSSSDFSCLGVINVSVYKINALAGAGSFLWAGYNNGMIYVYDTRTQPWTVQKDWQAHDGPVANILVDRSSVWKIGRLQVASIGLDNAIRLWDGMLEEDWLENDMQDHDTDYCEFREIKAIVATWNAGAATPTDLRHEGKDASFFREVLQVETPPEILVFAFQELVDLEDKRLTAKTLFKGSIKKVPSEQEHMSRQYRAWRDYLVRCIEDSMPTKEPYYLLHTSSMVGLFSCIFVKASERNRISNMGSAEVKRGMGGLHGNKGALILRFVIDNSSLCFVNCHLAAGQTQTVHRNNDVAAILESAALPVERSGMASTDTFVGGGDGSMIMDHEICVLNGDLNYRIDTMGRDTVVKAINANNLPKLLERDQLLVSRRRNPGFRLRAFTESPITFAPTYKYDVGSDRYDSSEKHRSPAWCDRILYRGTGRIKQLEYRRHDLRTSDHRPVSGTFKMRIKTVLPKKRLLAWQESEQRFEKVKQNFTIEAKYIYPAPQRLCSIAKADQANGRVESNISETFLESIRRRLSPWSEV